MVFQVGLPCHSYPDSAHLYGSAAEGDDVFDPIGTATAATSSSASSARAVIHVKPVAHLMEAGKLVQPEGDPEGHQDH